MVMLKFVKIWWMTKLSKPANLVKDIFTLRRKNTDTFASVCSKMAIFKRLENYLKDANFLIFSSITSCIDEKSFSKSFGLKIFTGTDFTTCQSWKCKKTLLYEVKMERSNFDSSYFQNHWKFCNQNSFRSFPNMVNQLVKR